LGTTQRTIRAVVEEIRRYPAVSEIFAASNPLLWAERNVRIQHQEKGKFVPFSISNGMYQYPQLREIYHFFNRKARHVHGVAKKPVQMAYTTLAMNLAYYFTLAFHQNTLYGLPVAGQLGPFTHNRLDPQIENSPQLTKAFNDISNVGMKKSGDNAIYLRGMQSVAQLEELPVGLIIRDELDRMDQDNASLVLNRLQGNPIDWTFDLSHPTHPGEGIDYLYEISSRGEWVWTCPHCGTVQNVDWFENVDIENIEFICADCHKPVEKTDLWGLPGGRPFDPYNQLAFYQHEDKSSPIRGWHSDQLLSPQRPLELQIRQWLEAQGHPNLLRRFYNGVLGLAYAEEGEQITREAVKALMEGQPTMRDGNTGGALGIDVGAGLHGWFQNDDECQKVFHVGNWSDIDYYIKTFQPEIMVIDAEPEHHKARDYAAAWTERGIPSYVCIRTGGRRELKATDHSLHTISVNYTEQFDAFFGGLRSWRLPSDLPEEAIDHLCAPVRIQKETTTGMLGTWKKGVNHFCDAAMYAMEGWEILEKRRMLTNVRPASLTKESKYRKHERIKRTKP